MKTGKKWQNIRKEIKQKSLAADLFFDVVGSIFYAAGIYTFAGDSGFAPG